MYYVLSMQARRNSGKGNNTNIMQFHPLQNINPSYSSKINGFLYHQMVTPPLKKRPDMLSEGKAALHVGCDSPVQIVMAVWRPFCLNLNFLDRA